MSLTRSISFLSVALAASLLVAPASRAESGSYRNPSINENFRNGSMLVEYEMYEDAITYLLKADKEEPNNADINNLLGFSYRKLGQYNKANHYYQKALRIDPKHRGALEYLGELYLETNQLSKAKQQLARLDEVCLLRCDEYNKLKQAIEATTRRMAEEQ
ncbi:MAG TPA: tetratricopeptide repeat protein [Gammaproteobacteria bacterium]